MDQGTDVKLNPTNSIVDFANLTVQIFDSETGGVLIYEENFTNIFDENGTLNITSRGIVNGSWNVMLGDVIPLPLEFGKQYFKNYLIQGDDINFTNATGDVIDRLFFFSPLGDIGNEDLNLSSLDVKGSANQQ